MKYAGTTLPALAIGLALAGCGSGDEQAPGFNAADGPQGRFLALSYNVAGLPEAISGEQASSNARLISPLLNDYDLVILQEDWDDPVVALEALGVLPAGAYPGVLGYHHLIVADARHPHRSEPAPAPLGFETRRGLDGVLGPTIQADGLNRLSRSPFGTVERVLWQVCHGSALVTPLQLLLEESGLDAALEPAGLMGDEGLIDDGSADCAAQKGFSLARHELAPGVEIDVYNVHADAGGHDLDLAARIDNFAQFASFIQERSAGRAVILGGDTNLAFESDRRERRQELDGGTWRDFQAETGLIDVCAVLACGDPDALREQGFKNHDRFAFRSGGGIRLRPVAHAFERERFTRDDGEQLSDHDPVAVRFEWRQDAAAR